MAAENKNANVPKQAYSTEEVAAALGLSASVVKRMIAKSEIGSVLISGSRRITARQLDDYLRSREAASGWTPAA